MQENSQRQNGHYPFPVRSVLSWTESSQAWVRPLIHAFKDGWQVRAAEIFSELLISRPCSFDSKVEQICFVFPTSRTGRFDHAAVLVAALGKFFPTAQVYELHYLDNEDSISQKQKTSTERANRRFKTPVQLNLISLDPIEPIRAKESPQQVQSEYRYIFVDDVVTSGSTAMAAYMALGDPDHFEVWALACRPKLAPRAGF